MEPTATLPISAGQAAGLLVAYGLAYVLPLYVFRASRPSRILTRDAPLVIQTRIRVAITSTALCSLCTLFLLIRLNGCSYLDSLHALGYWPVGIAETGRALLLTATLFAGPLYELFLVEGAWRWWLHLEPLSNLWRDLRVWRNIVAGPVTEEVLFRSASIPILLSAGTSLRSVMFLSPLVFGVAHVHHFFETRITRPDVTVSLAMVSSLVQLSFTSLFGTYATFIYLRTGSLLAVIIIHAFCNSLGLPRFWGHVEPWWQQPWQRGARDQETKNPWPWTLPYYTLLGLGAYFWWQGLYHMTASRHALALHG